MPARIVTPEEVMDLQAPSKDFLCPLSANTYEIDFLNFEICDYDTKSLIFKAGDATTELPEIDLSKMHLLSENALRTIKYTFPIQALKLPRIQTSLTFSVGGEPVPNLRMIEHHYFRDEIVKTYDFKFGFCIPNSTNSWDAVYELPPLDEDLVEAMIKEPYSVSSDSFYFVDDELVIHNKALYKYVSDEEEPQEKLSCSKKPTVSAKAGAKLAKGGSFKGGQKVNLDEDDDDDDDMEAEEKFTASRVRPYKQVK